MPRSTETRTSPNGSTGAGLDNNANNSSTLDAWDRRRGRHELRYGLNRITSLDRVRKCGRCSRVTGGCVEVRVRDGVAAFAGLVSCTSVWACPVCAAKISQIRAIETGLRVAAGFAQGLSAVFLTHTVRHTRKDRLSLLLDGLGYGWGRMTSGRAYSQLRSEAGVVGYSRALEVTHGRNGWHPHYHSLWFTKHLQTMDDVEAFGLRMWVRMDQGVQKAGLRSTVADAQDWQLVSPTDESTSELSKYLHKMADPAGIGYELHHTQTKRARSKNSTDTHWALLAEAVHGVTPDLWLWREYEQATFGKRQMTNSIRLDEVLGVVIEEKTDEEIAAEELGTVEDTIAVIQPEGWALLVADFGLTMRVLETATVGQDALVNLLDKHGIAHLRR